MLAPSDSDDDTARSCAAAGMAPPVSTLCVANVSDSGDQPPIARAVQCGSIVYSADAVASSTSEAPNARVAERSSRTCQSSLASQMPATLSEIQLDPGDVSVDGVPPTAISSTAPSACATAGATASTSRSHLI